MSASLPAWFHEIDHTGDVGIQVTAPTMPQLFERAAEGTFHVLADLSPVRPVAATTITVREQDREALMVRWLSELNYRHTVDRVLFCTFTVAAIERAGADLALTATVQGEPIEAERHTVHTEIKAVTFHGLHLDQTQEGWETQIIFDM